jgi:uncharacterized protein DUF3383
MTIPASNIVQVNPGVLSAGGSALVANGLILSTDPATPIGAVLPFASASDVSAYFGAASPEATYANIYFNGFDNATLRPQRLYFAQYPTAAVGGWLRTGSLASMTLAQLQALTGVLTITVGGTPKTSATINLSGATSFSNAAALILAGFTSPGFTCVYDSQRAAFLFTNTTTGTAGSMSFGSGTLAAGIKATQATGAVLSPGSAIAVQATFMESVVAITQNWVAFMTTWEPLLADKILFANWVVSKSNRYLYVAWDTDVNAVVANNQTAFGPLMLAAQNSGVASVYVDPQHAAFILGITASTDFSRTNGRLTYAFKHLAGLIASVTDGSTANILEANGYNFYGAYATANDNFVFLYPGNIAGQYKFIDAYVNQIYLNSQLQLAIMSLLTSVVSIPYNPQGYALIDAACMDPINAALNFGAIRNNVPLSASQAAQANNAAGAKIDDVLAARGWYLQIKAATPQVRAARGSPPMTLWYMDGGAVQRITLASILVQ